MCNTTSSWGSSATPQPKALWSRAGAWHPGVWGDLVCPNCSFGAEWQRVCGYRVLSIRGEVWVWVIFKHSPTPPQNSSSCHLRISWFSLAPHHTSLSPSPGWGSQRVGTGWSRSRVEWGNSLGMVRSASASSWLCLWYAGADLSREKATTHLPGEPGL